MKYLTAALACVVSMLASPALAQTKKPAPEPAAGLSADTRQKLMVSLERATSYLLAHQQPDGNFENHAGIAGMVASALVRQPGPGKDASRAAVNRTLDYLRTLAKPDGGIYQKDIPHYVTAVAAMAFVAGGRPEDQAVVANAKTYLSRHLLDESEGITNDNKFYGGMGYGGTGYGSTSDPGMADIVSLEYGLRALKDAGMDDKDPAWRRALEFLQRTQNLKETNDQKWAANDGGFVYYPGKSMVAETDSYGAATYAGLMSYAWASLSKLDPRVQAALKWVRNNYTVDENPGLGQKTVYYYYMVFAKALQAVGEDVIVDSKRVRHNWREDLGRKLLTLQKPEGYWVNTDPSEMQNNKVLVTAFTMQAIEAILQ